MQNAFPSLREYESDFIEFIRSKNFYADEATQKIFLENFALDIINHFVNDIAKKNRGLIENPSPESRAQFLTLFENQIDAVIQNWSSPSIKVCPEFVDYTFELFSTYSNDIFIQIKELRFTANGVVLSDTLMVKIQRCVYSILRAQEEITNYTGLIFSGFGDEEIYPRLIAVNISIVVDNRLRFYINEKS